MKKNLLIPVLAAVAVALASNAAAGRFAANVGGNIAPGLATIGVTVSDKGPTPASVTNVCGSISETKALTNWQTYPHHEREATVTFSLASPGLNCTASENGLPGNTWTYVTPLGQPQLSLSASPGRAQAALDAWPFGAGPVASGTVTYTVYADASCQTFATVDTRDSNNVVIPGQINAQPAPVTVTNATVPGSGPVTIRQTGLFWQAVYTGDPNNSGAASACVAAVVSPPSP